MVQRDHAMYETYMMREEVAEEADKKEKASKEVNRHERDTFFDELNRYRRQREMDTTKYGSFSESVYENHLQTALDAIYIGALQSIMPMSEENISMAQANVARYIKENGASNIIYKNSKKTYLLDAIFEAVIGAHDQDMKFFEEVSEDEEKEDKKSKVKLGDADNDGVDDSEDPDMGTGDKKVAGTEDNSSDDEKSDDKDEDKSDGKDENLVDSLDDDDSSDKDKKKDSKDDKKSDKEEKKDDSKSNDKEEEKSDKKEDEENRSEEQKDKSDESKSEDDSGKLVDSLDQDDEDEESTDDNSDKPDPGFRAMDDDFSDEKKDSDESDKDEDPILDEPDTKETLADAKENSKKSMFDKLENDSEVSDAVNVIAQRISDAETEFIKKNAADKKKIEKIVNRVDDRIKAVTDNGKEDSKKKEESDKIKQEATRMINDISENRCHTMYELMFKENAEAILRDESLMEAYSTDGKLDYTKIQEATMINYGWLETLNTLQLEKFNEELIFDLLTK